MRAAVMVEWWKFKRSPVVSTATVLLVVLIPALGLGFHTVAERGGAGPLAQKAAALHVGPGWEGYLGAVDQISAAATFIGAGIVVAWVFAREHADRTFTSLFALPVSRATIAAAKFVVLLVWAVVLSVVMATVAVGLGLATSVGQHDLGVAWPVVQRLFVVTLSSSTLALPAGLVASIGRGYLPAIGAIILTVAAAQVSVLFGTGGWFPFAVPGLIAVAGIEGVPTVGPAQIALVLATVAASIWLTIAWWSTADAI